jgi:hypothetical protein
LAAEEQLSTVPEHVALPNNASMAAALAKGSTHEVVMKNNDQAMATINKANPIPSSVLKEWPTLISEQSHCILMPRVPLSEFAGVGDTQYGELATCS